MRQGDLGQLPLMLRWVKVPNFQRPTKTAFDAVELGLLIRNGDVVLDPVKLSGDAISLVGSGTLALQGDRQLDLRLSPVYGRDERPVPILGPVLREATGQLFDVHVTGPLASPAIKPEPLPDVLTRAGRAARRLAERRAKPDAAP